MTATKYAERIIKYTPSWLYKAAASAWFDANYPRHLFIETTAACNLTCSYCPREDISKSISIENAKKIVLEASQYGARSFSLHLFGEPLLYRPLENLVRFIKECNSRHTVLLTTNGTLLNQHVDWLVDKRVGVDRIHWTWREEATFSSETKKKLKRSGKFLVRILKEITPKEAMEEWNKWPSVQIRSLHNYGGDIQLSGYGLSDASHSDQRWPCYHLWFAPAVAYNGDILVCCSDPHHKEILGNIENMSVAEAWTSEQMNKIRRGHLRGQYPEVCKNCDVWKNYPRFN